MIFVCNRSGPVPAAAVGLRNNPESDHLREPLEREIAAWNLRNPDQILKLFTADDRFPIERWSPDLFDILPFVKVEAAPAGPPSGDIHVLGNVRLQDSLRNGSDVVRSASTDAGVPFYTRHVWIGNFTGTVFGPVAHGIPGNIVSGGRLINVTGLRWHNEPGTTRSVSTGYSGSGYTFKHVHVTDTEIRGEWRLSVITPSAYIFACIEYF